MYPNDSAYLNLNNPLSFVLKWIKRAVEDLQSAHHLISRLSNLFDMTGLKTWALSGCIVSQEHDVWRNIYQYKVNKDAPYTSFEGNNNMNKTKKAISVSLPKFDLLLTEPETKKSTCNEPVNTGDICIAMSGTYASLSKIQNKNTTDIEDKWGNINRQKNYARVKKFRWMTLEQNQRKKQILLLPNETTDSICTSYSNTNSYYQEHDFKIKNESPELHGFSSTITNKSICPATVVAQKVCRHLPRKRCRNNRNMLIPTFFLIVCASTTAEALPLFYQPPTEPPKLMSEKILLSETCSYQKFACPPPENFQLKLTNCGFTDSCLPGHKPICVNVAGKANIFCSPSNLTCAAGYHRRAVNDGSKSDKIIIAEERCPLGTYESATSDCYRACQNNHRQFLPKRYLVHTPGNHINHTLVYCNYNIGYYNAEGKFLLDFDEDEEHDNFFCQHVNVSDPCKSGQFPLPNGTCVIPCSPEEFRDDFDGFVCKSRSSNTQESSTRGELQTPRSNVESVREESILISTSASGVHREGHLLDWTAFNSSLEENHERNMDWWRSNARTVIIVAVIVAVLVILGIVICCILAHRIKSGRWFWCSSTSNGTGTQQRHTTEYHRVNTNETNNVNCTYTNINGENIVIHINNSSMTIGNSDDTGVSLHGSDLQENSLSDGPDGNGGSPESGFLLDHDYEIQESVEQQSLVSEMDGTQNKEDHPDTTAPKLEMQPSCAIEMDETQSKEVDFDTPVKGRSKPTATVLPLKPRDYNTTMMDLKE